MEHVFTPITPYHAFISIFRRKKRCIFRSTLFIFQYSIKLAVTNGSSIIFEKWRKETSNNKSKLNFSRWLNSFTFDYAMQNISLIYIYSNFDVLVLGHRREKAHHLIHIYALTFCCCLTSSALMICRHQSLTDSTCDVFLLSVFFLS